MTVLACDLGGTRIKYGLVQGGAVTARSDIPAYSDRGLAPRLPALSAALRALCDAQGIPVQACDGVAMSFPSIMDPRTGRVLAEFGKYRDAPEIDLRAWARGAFNLPLAIENDARMALIGEWCHGAGRGSDNVVMMTLGTGLGTCAVIEGRVLRGVHGQAGIMCGHLTIEYDGPRCHCGNIGCAEAVASTAHLGRIAHGCVDFGQSGLARETVLDYAAVFRHAAEGDACAISMRDHSLRAWSANVVNLIHAYDPEIVILGGGIMASGAIITDAVQEYVDRHALTPWGRVAVVASQLGDDAALVAGEWLIEEQKREGWLD